jgi:hypothetical protein
VFEASHPGLGGFAGQAGLIGEQPTNFGLIVQLGGDLTALRRVDV